MVVEGPPAHNFFTSIYIYIFVFRLLPEPLESLPNESSCQALYFDRIITSGDFLDKL